MTPLSVLRTGLKSRHTVQVVISVSRRRFHPCPRIQAAESPDSLIANIKNTSLFKKIADKPEALKALSDFAALLQEQGFDASGRNPPSTMQMFKLAANSKFREGARRVVDELQKAGIDLTSKVRSICVPHSCN
ncbi:hypothetical protein GLOTRDRAFT_34057 [Gloeophyllum trabeum ATCC 11539]|uniref:Uncharacterized protein n=1 Tax=Gloeophyllum trabeum (strain ATCC 11539 / FP-39264 / Madison 617) TaxID=670483 RepID=S7RWU4_GLOTA|nr:uncharacterized protein GLOTRDRAFT_34057 [Gloeophyllum trabeum ATCC 11539]EPQ59370.1 hypothetical protein GLOTRDRAFT_34057 [Gloeophyllum trabeum ATCC 11539]